MIDDSRVEPPKVHLLGKMIPSTKTREASENRNSKNGHRAVFWLAQTWPHGSYGLTSWSHYSHDDMLGFCLKHFSLFAIK